MNAGKHRGTHPNHNGGADGQNDTRNRREILVGRSAIRRVYATVAIINEGIRAVFKVKEYVKWGVCGKICVGIGVAKPPRVKPSTCRLLLAMQEVL